MALIRILILAFNVAIVTFLVYRLLQIYRSPSSRKGLILTAGTLLIILPVIIMMGFIKPAVVYFMIYPVAISLFLYGIKNEAR